MLTFRSNASFFRLKVFRHVFTQDFGNETSQFKKLGTKNYLLYQFVQPMKCVNRQTALSPSNWQFFEFLTSTFYINMFIKFPLEFVFTFAEGSLFWPGMTYNSRTKLTRATIQTLSYAYLDGKANVHRILSRSFHFQTYRETGKIPS